MGPGRAPHLGAIAKGFDTVLFDAYGVLNVGETPIIGAAARVAELRGRGKRVMVVSNSAGYPKRAMVRRFETLGFEGPELRQRAIVECAKERLSSAPKSYC